MVVCLKPIQAIIPITVRFVSLNFFQLLDTFLSNRNKAEGPSLGKFFRPDPLINNL